MENYSTAFKKRKSGKLVWVVCGAESEKEALNKSRAYAAYNYPKHRLYAGPLLEKTTQL